MCWPHFFFVRLSQTSRHVCVSQSRMSASPRLHCAVQKCGAKMELFFSQYCVGRPGRHKTNARSSADSAAPSWPCPGFFLLPLRARAFRTVRHQLRWRSFSPIETGAGVYYFSFPPPHTHLWGRSISRISTCFDSFLISRLLGRPPDVWAAVASKLPRKLL